METILRSKNVLIDEQFVPADVVVYGEFITRVDECVLECGECDMER